MTAYKKNIRAEENRAWVRNAIARRGLTAEIEAHALLRIIQGAGRGPEQ